MFTRSGITVAVSAVILLVAGWYADYPELVILAFACLAALLVAAIWMLARPDLTAIREIRPHRVAVGEKAYGAITVTNEARRRSPPIEAAEAVAGQRLNIPLPSLASGESHQTTYPLPTGRRGIFQVGPLAIGHTDPLRLMRVGKEYATCSSTGSRRPGWKPSWCATTWSPTSRASWWCWTPASPRTPRSPLRTR